MAKKTEPRMRFVCLATATDGELVLVVGELSKDVAIWLMDRVRILVLMGHAIAETFYSVEIFDSSCSFGKTITAVGDAGDDPPPDLDPAEHWQFLPPGYEINDEIRTTAQTLIATVDGVSWSAEDKNSEARFETRQLDWDQLGQIANGKNPFTEEKNHGEEKTR